MRNKMLWLIFTIVIIATTIGSFLIFRLYQISQFIGNNVPTVMKELEIKYQLDKLAEYVHYYDEVLTQSARNYAFTGDVKWKTRYNENVGNLDEVIKQAQVTGGEIEKEFFVTVDTANTALVEMEEDAMASVDAGDKTKAVAILESQAYSDQKKIYQAGLDEYLNFRGGSTRETFTNSFSLLSGPINSIHEQINSDLWIFTVAVFFGFAISLILGWLFSLVITKSISKLTKASEKIADGNLDENVDIKTNDEVGELGRSFNKMIKNLRESHEDIEQKVAERTAELGKLNKFMVGRELKMAELKKEIAQLKDIKNENTQ